MSRTVAIADEAVAGSYNEGTMEEIMEEFPVYQMEYDSSSKVIYASAVHAYLHFYLDWINAWPAGEAPELDRLLNIAAPVRQALP